MRFEDLENQLWEKTDGGKEILLYYYPQLNGIFGTKKKFAIRQESAPSASVKQFDGVWCVTDFGDEGKALNPIAVCMKEENCNRFEACKRLFARYGVTSNSNQSYIRFEEKNAEDKEGDVSYTLASFTPNDLKVMGRFAKMEHLSMLNWHKVATLRRVTKDKVVIKESTPEYPIFVRQCYYGNGEEDYFQKFYEPMNQEKQYRFTYYGKPQGRYIHGLTEARMYYESVKDGDNEIVRPLAICCGERDALNALSLGMQPVWFNSETAKPTEEDMMQLRQLNREVYLVSDIDVTGKREGRALALRFPWLKAMWLPESLLSHKDWRGNSMKDLRDWVSLGNGMKNFWNLAGKSMSADYFLYDDKGMPVSLNLENLLYFLSLNDFGVYNMHIGDNVHKLVCRRVGYSLEEITDMTDIVSFLKDNLPVSHNINRCKNLLNNSNKLNENFFKLLPLLPYTLDTPKKHEETMYFLDCVVSITKDGVTTTRARDYQGMTLKQNIIQHELGKYEEPFVVDMEDDSITVNLMSQGSPFLNLLTRLCFHYWKEDQKASGLSLADYYRTREFSYYSPLLSEEQNATQLCSFLNLLFCVGYHRSCYRSASEPWCTYVMDSVSNLGNSNNGGSGKGIFVAYCNNGMKTVTINGRDKKVFANNHAFERVGYDTRAILIDDYDPSKMKFDYLYPLISTGITVNPKGKKSFEIPASDAPKIILTSNKPVPDETASTNRRKINCAISDWYHEVSPNSDYASSHTVVDDFHKDLMHDYTEEEWQADYRVIIRSVQFFMKMVSLGKKLDSPHQFVQARINSANINEEIDDWATVYFSDSAHIDVKIEREIMYNDFLHGLDSRKYTSQRFKKMLKAWLEIHGMQLNNHVSADSSGRIIAYSNVLMKQSEFFYVSRK